MLVRISFSKFNPQRGNKQGELEYARNHGTNEKANKMTTRLVPKQFIDPLQRIETEARAAVRHLTAPFEDGGNRIVTAEVVPQLQDTIAKLRRQWDNAVDDFVGEWDKILAQAKADLNGDFHKYVSLYPSAEEVRGRFVMDVTFMPMPDHSRLLDSVREEMASVYQNRINAAGADLRSRLREKLEHLANRCAEVGNEKTRFYESNVTNVLELCDLLPKMLLGDDPELLAAIDEARKMLDGIDADVIKSSTTVATSVRNQANSILTSLL